MYLNVDLEIRGRERLDALITALAKGLIVVSHHERTRGRSFACLSGPGDFDGTPDVTLRRWARMLGALRGEPRRIFRASRVIASIGLEDDDGMTSTRVVVAPEQLASLARLGVGIEVVVYRRNKQSNAKRVCSK